MALHGHQLFLRELDGGLEEEMQMLKQSDIN
jgi:hypothetical protein